VDKFSRSLAKATAGNFFEPQILIGHGE